MSGLKIILLTLLLTFSSIALGGSELYQDMLNKKPPISQEGSSLESEEVENSYYEQQRLRLIENNVEYVKIVAGMYVFSLLIITVLTYMTPNHHVRDLVTLVGLVTVIFMSIFLALVVDNTDALVAPMGILGAIGGYLFGTAQTKGPEG